MAVTVSPTKEQIKTIDWSLLPDLPHDEKISFLAGGLNPLNITDALQIPNINGFDTSSGVENDNGIGKNREKIMEFTKKSVPSPFEEKGTNFSFQQFNFYAVRFLLFDITTTVTAKIANA